MTRFSLERLILLIILFTYLVVGALFAIYTPAWQTPDEPAHYNYIAQVANNGCCPQITSGDWNAPYQDELKSAHFREDLLGELDTIQYEDHQPPFYYLLSSIVYKLTDGSLIGLRLFSVLIGLLIVLSAYGISKIILPDHPEIALGTAALVAFLPQHIAILASVNNDAIGWAIVAITLLAVIKYLNTSSASWRFHVLLGILVGLGLVTKASTYFLAGIVPLAILLKWWGTRRTENEASWRELLQNLALFLLPALILGALWWTRNFSVYGFPDFLGLRAHDAVVSDQPRTEARIAQLGFGGYLSEAIQITFNSFWGQFGWMALPMPSWIYLALQALLGASIIGWLVNWFTGNNDSPKSENSAHSPRYSYLILALTAFLAVLQYLYYNTEFLQLQGRYMFTGLIPFTLGIVLGLDALRRLVLGRFEWSRWLIPVAMMAFAALDVYLLGRFIVPLLSP